MRCDKALELFSDYCDGSIKSAIAIPFEDHINTCATCREQLTDLKSVWSILDAAPVIEPPAGLRAEVWRRIESAEQVQATARRKHGILDDWRRLFTRPVAGWTAALIAVIALTGVIAPGHFTAASMFPWVRTARPASVTVNVGNAKLTTFDNRSIIEVPISFSTPAVKQVEVTVDGSAEPAQVISVDATRQVVFTIDADKHPLPFKLNLSWTLDGKKSSKTININ